MKKIISILIALAIAFSSISMITFAESENLLENGDFANGTSGIYASGKCTMTEEADSADGDDCCLMVSDRNANHNSPAMDGKTIIAEQGEDEYTFSLYAKLPDDETGTAEIQATIQMGWDGADTTWAQSKPVTLTKEWQKISVTTTISPEKDGGAIKECKLYFTQKDFVADSNAPNILVDAYSLTKKGEVVKTETTETKKITDDTVIPTPATVTERSEKTQIGAIRWDAYFATTDKGNSVANQVAACLSPAEFHYIAPYFADITADGKVTFPEATLEQWEEEAQMAIDAGIDYFAYCLYDNSDPMSYGAKFHIQSELHNKIKMSVIMSKSGYEKKTLTYVFDAMKQDYWLRFGGMPVVFIYGESSVEDNLAEKLRKLAVSYGVEEPLFFVAMGNHDASAFLNAKNNGMNATGHYSISAKATGETFAELTARTMDENNILLKSAGLLPPVLAATVGRNSLPRVKTGVTWSPGDPNAENPKERPYANLYTQDGTADELYENIYNVLKLNYDNADKTPLNSVLIYAWNEHDEGGWICPTILVDESGNPILDANGNKQKNTTNLDAVKRAITAYRNLEGGISVDIPDGEEVVVIGTNNYTWLYVLGGVALVAVAVVVVVIALKKKKPEKTDKPQE